ncbi:hypothetical protein LSG31_17175 [Fodinisporobacter ferrooxydans]|uniref:Uncharacterized protein n=1 Tax=Fodinisporobacter ferrooxydans TaxID=2901836 RepID=A0ABY4CHV2_9BACL|nr:hypothetical protein LSG31_17175 [Alicyclobacillaceae bacterium MYW30-H2]
MIDIYTFEYNNGANEFIKLVKDGKVSNSEYYQFAIAQLEFIKKASPNPIPYINQQAEYYHLDGNLRRAGEQYHEVLRRDPFVPLSEKETERIRKFCPILRVIPKECFPLKDFVAIHHPTEPLIGYHFFWEDDYDFPDDYEPCDHEEMWVKYDPETEIVTNVMSFFHSRVIESDAAVLEAGENHQRPVIRIEWGKHGSLLKGWEEMQEPLTGVPIMEWLKTTYEHVKAGGRVPKHPLKRFWPQGFEGTWEEYVDFSITVDPLKLLEKKPLMFKTRWVNAVMFTQCLLYNFHPKMEWPERFFDSIQDEKGTAKGNHESYQIVNKG